VCLENLSSALLGEPGGAEDAWAEVHSHYVAAFGPEAATIGVPEQ
jgi:hypothetical protein